MSDHNLILRVLAPVASLLIASLLRLVDEFDHALSHEGRDLGWLSNEWA